ncbi:platelet-derived growth factor receptor-like protein [Choloepus didactylus]|uniref:platelet-derived growth factor receptor-like protein n=1 Tax=Choloepus didactylus TaxID=27675 RepID=UPI00189EC82E|nr:platelet-derived growth factor receptor-like protein [Choloepus didactylus]
MDPRALCFLTCCLLVCVISAEIQNRGRTTKAQKKKGLRAAIPGEVKPSGPPGQRKPKSVKNQKSPQTKTPVEAAASAALSPLPSSILVQPLELRCLGRVVRWRVPVYLEEEGEGRLRIKHLCQHSQLLVVNSTSADTGEHSCWAWRCQDGACTEGEALHGKSFIFFTDPEELFVPTEDYYQVVQLHTHQPDLLPCQVTNPLAHVTLHREFPPEEIPVDGMDISFDVKKGFIIHWFQASLSGSLFCMASLGGMRQISTKYMLIYINYPSSSPKPTIQASATSVQLGENFSVNCTVLGEPEIAVDFSWEYPSQKLGRPPYTSERVDVVRWEGQVQQDAVSTLYVEETQAGDAGVYTCWATNLQGTGTAATRIRVIQSPQPPSKPWPMSKASLHTLTPGPTSEAEAELS